MEICKYEDCTGCFACYNIYPKNCIGIEPDIYGELHPVIDEKKCINCKNCIKVCPGNKNNIELFKPIKCYAAYRVDKEKRADSASGGIGALLSEIVINNGGIVVGVKFDENLLPIHSIATTLEEIEVFKGSKYVQSRINDTYKRIRKNLEDKRLVLFIGTPCQVSGLKMYLNNKEYDNLITCDLICHGVSSYIYLKEHISNLNTTKNIDKITFRSNRIKSNYRLKFFNNGRVIYNKRVIQDNYFYAFFKGISLRESCYDCKYATEKRIADITIGDFIGLGKNKFFKGNAVNASVVLINSIKGEKIFDEIKKDDIYIEEREYAEAINGGISLRRPFPRYKEQKEFRKIYPKVGFEKSINKLMKWDKRKSFVIALIKYIKRNTIGKL